MCELNQTSADQSLGNYKLVEPEKHLKCNKREELRIHELFFILRERKTRQVIFNKEDNLST